MTPAEPKNPDDKDGDVEIDERDFNMKFWFADDGRINLDVSQRAAWISDDIYSEASVAMNTPEQSEVATSVFDEDLSPPPPYSDEQLVKPSPADTVPRMNIVMLAIGPLEEISPFVALGHFLSTQYGHRVRLASHSEHRIAIEDKGVEFYSIGSTPSDMIWSPGSSETRKAINKHRISKWRKGMSEVFRRSWKACIDTTETGLPFVADAIIASPLCLPHIHCAERLGVPLHLLSSMPWTPTGDSAHPLANVQRTNSSYRITNILSYTALESLIWREIGDDVNRFRKDTLQLEPMDLMFAPGLISRMQVPVMYTSSLISKRPGDWGNHVYLCDPQAQIEAMGDFFHRHLALSKRTCPVTTNHLAYWAVKGIQVPLSSTAVVTLLKEDIIDAKNLQSRSLFEWDLAHRPLDPLTGLTAATSDAVTSILLGVAAGPIEAYKQVKAAKEKEPSNKDSSRASHELNPYSSVAISTGKGVGNIMAAGLKTPVTFTYGLAKGFHNVPRLYGDTTVRDSDNITGWKSGLVASGKNFGYGLYDGLSGFVMQPVRGAQKEGVVGFAKGFGKGVGGLICKPAAGACGVPGYAFKGFYEELRKLKGSSVEKLVTVGRMAIGEEEWSHLTKDEKVTIVTRWKKYMSLQS